MAKSVKVIIFGFIAAVIMIPALSARADPVKIVIMDSNRAINEVNTAKRAQAEIKQRVESLEAELSKLGEELQRMQQDYQKQAAMLNPEARAQKEEELQAKARNFNARRMAVPTEVAAAEKAVLDPIISKMGEILQKLAQQQGYNLILERRVILFHDASLTDITDEVISVFNRENP
ncbi:MAG: OmpH family outer membrane protein [Desulfarculales bacterium]|jgi:outer membrane protein|nr:OmpH family outer membrane protein [Desulfarculales bacterium]